MNFFQRNFLTWFELKEKIMNRFKPNPLKLVSGHRFFPIILDFCLEGMDYKKIVEYLNEKCDKFNELNNVRIWDLQAFVERNQDLRMGRALRQAQTSFNGKTQIEKRPTKKDLQPGEIMLEVDLPPPDEAREYLFEKEKIWLWFEPRITIKTLVQDRREGYNEKINVYKERPSSGLNLKEVSDLRRREPKKKDVANPVEIETKTEK